MAFDPGLIAWVAKAMAPIGAVTHRRMMGGATLYCDGTVFAIVSQDALWFKADAQSDAEWDALGCERIVFDMNGKTASMNYRRAPDAAYDEADELRRLGELGLAAGLRKPPARPRRRAARSTPR